ncbi:MAG: penicillin-binding protein 2, partial [Actinomycetota bacterium]|nr:penicillin-binding protein 2 [Actinomycetota bacterium]
MNRQIRLVGLGIIALFVALFVQLNYLQVVRASSLDHDPRNGRAVVKEFDTPRGDIVAADGVTLAHSQPTSDQFKYLRQYPQGPLFSQLTGFFSFTYGSDGAERTYDRTLTGANAKNRVPANVRDLKRLLTSTDKTQAITMSVSQRMQQAAKDALGNKVGSVVAINPSTGAIVAMYSNPTYDPNLLTGHSTTQVTANRKTLIAAAGNPLSPGAYRNRRFPGSTFKILTSSAVYDRAPSLATKTYPTLSALPLPQTTTQLHNFAGENCGGQLPALFTVSCNTGFGAVGLDLGAANLYDEAHAFGFDQKVPIDLPFGAESSFPPVSSFAKNLPAVAYSAIGQQDVQATPLEMALVASGIANNGVIMTPHVLGHVTDSQGRTLSTYNPKPWLTATSPQTAAQVTKLMLSVVNDPKGTGGAAAIPGVQVAAKTGTAQTGTGKIDAWFAAFAPNPNPTIAVAVLIPDQPSGNEYQGGTISAPIAKAVIQAWLAGGSAAAGNSAAAVNTAGQP